jgi:aspartate kinase
MKNTVVMKFGGTSVGSSDRISAVAKKIAKYIKEKNEQVVVVVSAMTGETDRLVELCRKVSGSKYSQREYHQLLSSGEQVSAALTAMALLREGVQAKSLLAHQVRIRTKHVYGTELIMAIDKNIIEENIKSGIVPIVAGFQGVDEFNNYTTLGRGGSDTTAVALAATLDSVPCIIFTDVDGVYTALPSICKQAKKLRYLTYEEMLELASSGAKVLQARSVHLAHKYKVPLWVRSSFSDDYGTEIVKEYKDMEDAVVSGITCRTDQVKITLRDIPDTPGTLARIFSVIGEAGIVVDMIVQTKGLGGITSLSFTVNEESGDKTFETLSMLVKQEMNKARIEIDKNIAKLSVVGEGMRTHAGVASKMFEILGREGINIDMVTTSEIKISVAIDQKYAELAVRSLHEHFIEF